MDHKQAFAEFCKYEKLTGGPDPHMAVVIELCKELDEAKKIWRIALYAGVYNVPTAEFIWSSWLDYPGATIRPWIADHWDWLRFRRERKTVGLDNTHGDKFMQYLTGVDRTIEAMPALKNAPFEEVWKFAMKLPHVGRYAATKLIECWRRAGLVNTQFLDICAKGGWSPRAGMNLIYGDYTDTRDDSKPAVFDADVRAARLKESFPELTWYEFEVLLCEYKASYSSKRQYPGRSLDSELAYERAVATGPTEHMRVRRLLSPEWALGEVQGWDPDDRLKNLGRVVSEYGYTWSDSLYDYNATTDFANPVRKT